MASDPGNFSKGIDISVLNFVLSKKMPKTKNSAKTASCLLFKKYFVNIAYRRAWAYKY